MCHFTPSSKKNCLLILISSANSYFRAFNSDYILFIFPHIHKTVNSASGVSSLPVYGGGHQSARDSRILQIAVIPANETPIPSTAGSPRSQIRGRSIANLDGFVEQQRPGVQREGVTRSSTRNYQDGPLNLNDKAHILFPDQFEQLQQLGAAKDSYGNPVTPFPLSNDELKLRAGAYKVDKTGFIIPSYASGITDVHDPHLPRLKKPNSNILPPFSSGNFYYPGVRPQASTDTIFVDRTDLSANELPLPPQLPKIPDIGSTVQTTLIEIPSDSLLPPLETDEYESQYNQPVDTNVPVPQKDILPPFQQQPQFQQAPPVPTQPGVQFTVATNQPVIVPFAPTPTPTQPAPAQPINVPHPTSVPSQTTENKYSGGFGFAGGAKPTTVFVNTVDNNKYQGGFILTPNTAPSQFPQLTTSLQAPLLPPSNNNDENKYTGSLPNSPVPAPTLAPTKPSIVDNRYAGGLGSASIPAQSTFTTSDTNKGNKYTGGFGYGNTNEQIQVQPIPAPSQQIQQQFPRPIASESSGQKYTGGFGGPPGILVPFDHIHSEYSFNLTLPTYIQSRHGDAMHYLYHLCYIIILFSLLQIRYPTIRANKGQ